ncbi:uncharacterized protein LOC102804147 [Saccoglossus kowalevskii]
MHGIYVVCLLVPLVCLVASVAAVSINIDECDYYCGGTCRAKKCNRGEIASENSYYYWSYGCSYHCGEGRVCCVEDYESQLCEHTCGGTCRSKKCNKDEITAGWHGVCSDYCGDGRVCCVPDYESQLCEHTCGGTCRSKKCNKDEITAGWHGVCSDYCGDGRVCCVPETSAQMN